MARIKTVGFEIGVPVLAFTSVVPPTGYTGQESPDGFASNTNVISSSSPARSGGKCIGASFSASGYVWHYFPTLTTGSTYWVRFYLYVTAFPAVLGTSIAEWHDGGQSSQATVSVAAGGTLTLSTGASNAVGNPTPPVTLNAWHCVEFAMNSGATANTGSLEFWYDGVQYAKVSGIDLAATINTFNAPRMLLLLLPIGASGTGFIYIDDLAVNDTTGTAQNGRPGYGAVAYLPAVADSSNTGWVNGTGGATSLFSSVSSPPPRGVALASATATSQIKSVNANATDTYTATLSSYSAAGIPSPSGGSTTTISVVQAIVIYGNSGSAVALAHQLTANPAAPSADSVTSPATAVTTWPQFWSSAFGTPVYAPSVTLASSPTLKITRSSSTGTYTVTEMGAYVDYLVQSPPSTPTNLTVSFNGQTATLNWTASTGTTPINYGLYRGTTSGGETGLANNAITTTSCTDTTPSTGTYYYQVYATNSISSSTLSNEASGVAYAIPVFLEPGGDATGDLSLYDSVPTPANTTADSLNAHTGTYGIKCVTAAGATGYGGQKNGVLADAGRRISFWVKFTGLPAQNPLLAKTSGGSICWSLTISALGALTLQDSAFAAATNQTSGPAALMVTGSWYRISLSYVVTSATASTFKAYVNGVLALTVTNPTTIVVGSSALCVGSWSNNYASGTPTIWFDDVYVDNGNDLTDPGNISVAAIAPTADSGSNGGTALGTARAAGSHFLNVSEIPKNDANGVQISLAAQTEESFTLGAAPTGTQVGYAGWLRAYQAANASTGNSGTSTVTNVGSSFSTALASLTVTGVTVAAGTAIFVAVTTNGNVTVTASDGSANVYTRHAKGFVATNNNTVLLSTPNAAGLSAATITASFGGVTTACAATVFTATNLLSSGGVLTLDGAAASGGSSSSSAAMSLSVTTTQANSLEIGAFGLAWSGDTLVAATGTAVVAAVSDGGSTSQIAKTAELLCVYRNLTASGASTVSATDSTSTARQCSNVAVAFRVAAAVAAVTPGTYQAVLNGSLFALSLVAVNTTYIFYPTSGLTTYPSAARGIGLTALATATDAVNLTEVGVLVAYTPLGITASPKMMAGFIVYSW